ncbi:hypothetical protein E4U60_001030 [Claviceps pazoutovae]|uniref:Uncharacterized protein n=1 Tax=Claviceps pazoutovae TaxID=1649127 RepID=A0A9P7SI16_9HYPO|nr:hypothetical protein E4U60_001030 [Claviceps pazoutovae]
MVSMVIILLSTVFLAVIYTWHRAYPRPYEDIPYSTQSARRLLGDIPDIIQYVRDGNDPEKFNCRPMSATQLAHRPAILRALFTSSILKQTTPEWRAQRQLWNDSMGQDFLHRIAAPKTCKVALQLLELFQLNTSIGNGRPFSVDTDFNLHIRFPAFVDSPAALPPTVKGGLFRAIEYLNSTMNVSVTSPLPGWYR